MKITILVENVAGGRLLAEHGLSYLIETESHKLLFDTGHSDIFIRNASKLGINIHEIIDIVILSHGHWDHGDGLQYMDNKTLITHPGSFIKRYRKKDNFYIGLSLNKSQIEQKFSLVSTEKPYKISETIIFLGEIPRLNDFEARETSFVDKNGNEDFVMDDSALVIIQNNALIIITGCSHAGICNIIEYAKKVTGIKKVNVVIGGFHLKHPDKQTINTIQYIKEQGIEKVYPSHCTELPALSVFYNEFRISQVKSGMILEL